MCMKRECDNCKKSTWWGCGSHIPGVMDGIPDADRCTCTPKVAVGGKEYPPKAGTGTKAGIEIAYEA